MLVSQVIETLQSSYKPTDEIYIDWWDTDVVQDPDNPISEEAWKRAIKIAEDADHSYIYGLVWEMLHEAVTLAKEEK